MPPSSHINIGGQVPQSRGSPQGFGTVPQFCPNGHDGGVQPIVVVVVDSVVVVVGHNPQSSMPPQPSGIIPQSAAPQVVAVQPHWLVTPPPPQVCGAVQVPQSRVPPQPSEAVPQFCPAGHDVAGLQAQKPGLKAPQVCGGVQVPQLSMPPQPSEAVPQFCPPGHDVAGVQQLPPTSMAPGAQQIPNNGGFATRGFAQFRLQQLMLVGHAWPLGLQGLGRASCAVLKTSAVTSATRAAR